MATPQQGVEQLKNGGRLMYGEVQSTQRLTPSMVRVVLGGSALNGFVPTPYTDQYINVQFFPGGAPYTAPFDPADFEALDNDRRPRGRRYTVWTGTTTSGSLPSTSPHARISALPRY